ncbi:hypothetical protein LCGC14_0370490 [marine sediment metagenome]|uniref:Uncharacterized protein n=1 Tax=marine sediment metagenome TaxID=412755 RepID=A0A0F9WDR7_9ZZZZ|nr:hypothetical protein [Maribacter sp.]HDZ04884.1 hypothetical protein [Maribacter sp.]
MTTQKDTATLVQEIHTEFYTEVDRLMESIKVIPQSEIVRAEIKSDGLIYGNVQNYKGDIPEKNINEIENFSIEDIDLVYENIAWGGANIASHKDYLQYEEKKAQAVRPVEIIEERGTAIFSAFNFPVISPTFTMFSGDISKAPLEIAAPIKDFNTKNMEIKKNKLSKIQVPDPVVLQPVYCDGQKHYLIVTAWGDEASDELVVNETSN